MSLLQDELRQLETVIATGKPWVPSRKLSVLDNALLQLQQKIERLRKSPKIIDKSTGTSAPISVGIPKQLLSVSATESPSVQQDRTFSQVAVSFTRDPQDKNFAGVHIWFTGYKGNNQPVLMADGADSPVIFLCETTKEVVTVTVQPFSASGQKAAFGGARTTHLALDGVVSAPPAPSLAATTTAITNGATTLGEQFSFNLLPASVSDIILGYWIYRAGSSTAPTPPAGRFQFLLHNPNQQGVFTFQDLSGVSTNYYWVSAVNKTGLESALTAAGTAGGGGGGPVTTTYRPTTNTNISGTPWTNPTYAYDGNSTTAASSTAGSTGTGGQQTWQGIPSAAGSPTSIKLKITSSGSVNSASAFIYYSLDGGSTYTLLHSGTWGQGTDVITLSNAQSLPNIKVKAGTNGGGLRTSHASCSVYEIWVEVTT